MRVLHVIPHTFEYFDDIKNKAFALLESQQKMGIDVEAFTLQYGATTKSQKISVIADAPSYEYKENQNIDSAIADFNNFDIVHLHCPFLGAAKKILDWKNKNLSWPLAVTYYRDTRVSDLFSIIVWGYHIFYLPKILNAADAIICESFDSFKKSSAWSKTSKQDKIFALDLINIPNDFIDDLAKITPQEILAIKTQMVYNSLVKV